MPDIIHLLPDSVANQIAAGEVIQRPASVVKELIENSLDAGATHIQVVVEDAGKSLIRVIDNGKGMSATDARLSFERHATSKITQPADLFALRTMGFRGEALASIAAVAQVELRTQMPDAELGTEIRIEGSKLLSQETIACPVGANFAVRNLFFNIPARRKFLKSNSTELSNILAEFERVALANPQVAFTIYSGVNLIMDLPAGNFRQRILSIFGNKIDKHLIPLEVKTSLANIRGYIGLPTSAKKKNAYQYLFANGRFMRHPYFAKAIQTAYERLIPEGFQIPFFINFTVDPARIDVNIHPTKTEIKFEDDHAIFQLLLAGVRESLGKFGAVPTIDFNTEGQIKIPPFNELAQDRNLTPPSLHINPNYNPFLSAGSIPNINPSTQSPRHETSPANIGSPNKSELDNFSRRQNYDWQQIYESTLSNSATRQEKCESHRDKQEDFSAQEEKLRNFSQEQELSPNQPSSATTFTQASGTLYENLSQQERQDWQFTPRDFLQYRGRFLVTPLHSGLALIDQHRAHMRILYEGYRSQLANHQAISQRLLFPESLHLSPSESLLLEQILPQLMSVGFELSPLGSNSWSILATPSNTDGISPTGLITSILADTITGQANAKDKIDHLIAHSLARKVALPIGQELSLEEMQHLIEQLFACSTPNLTPDGAPTFVILAQGNIEKMF